MEEELYKANSETYARTGDVYKLTQDSGGRVVFRTGKRNSYHYVCKACGAVRYIRPSDIERGRGQYCSMNCFYDSHPRCWFFCPVCGTLFSKEYGKAQKFATHYCSPECYNEAKSELMVPVNLSPSPELAYILGVMVGDGCAGEYTKNCNGKGKKSYDIKLGVIHYKFAKRFAIALKKIGLHPNTWKDKKVRDNRENEQKLWHTEAYSKVFVRFYLALKNDLDALKDFADNCPNGKRMFLRGFYESEGHHGVYDYQRGNRIQHVKHLHMTNTNPELVEIVIIAFLHDLGFHPYTDIQKREHLGWKDKTTIHLPPKEHKHFLTAIAPIIKK